MENNWNYDSVCTIVKDHKVDNRYYTTWSSTDGFIYLNDEQQNKEMSYKIVKASETCKCCPAQITCLKQIKKYGKTIY